jgi:hypothetical protein
VALTDAAILSSDSFREPHGVAFLGNDHVVVCNRGADVAVYRLPAPGGGSREGRIEPLARIPARGLFSAKVLTPGSVAAHELGPGRYRILVCNNHWNAVTAHRVSLGSSVAIRNDGVLLESRLKIPDGVAMSPGGAWIAVSNHVDGEVLLYRNTPRLDRRTPPAASLRGIVCPHGLRFTPDGRILVADAASQYLHVFESRNGSWEGAEQPAKSVRVVDDETFYAGRYDSREGGIKGLALDGAGRVLITTHKRDVLGFFDLDRLLSGTDPVDAGEMADLRRQRDSSVTRDKREVLDRRWTVRARVRLRYSNLRQRSRNRRAAARTRADVERLDRRNRQSGESLLDPAGPVVSLTTQPHRLELVFYAIESIGRGSRKPSRIHLWITDEKSYSQRPSSLERLAARGLEIHLTEELGPHTKYFPYVSGEAYLRAPLVTADDDVIYPEDWLERLIRAHEGNPAAIHCFRAHRMRMAGGRPTPYNSWAPCDDTRPSRLNFVTGVSGVIYPAAYLRRLKEAGAGFARRCPHADDIWLTVVALRGGFPIAQIEPQARLFPTIPGSQTKRLYDLNVVLGENQAQLMKTLSKGDLELLSGASPDF